MAKDKPMSFEQWYKDSGAGDEISAVGLVWVKRAWIASRENMLMPERRQHRKTYEDCCDRAYESGAERGHNECLDQFARLNATQSPSVTSEAAQSSAMTEEGQ